MTQDPIQQATARLTAAGLASLTTLIGCTEAEIRQIEHQYAVQLPEMYRQFLLQMGKAAGSFLKGSDLFFPEVLGLRKQAEAILADSDTPFTLTKEDFVFLVHQGYEFLFFPTGASGDPPVWLYLEDETGPEKLFDHFSVWLLASVSDEIQAEQT